MQTFKQYIDALFSEKGIDLEQRIEVEGPSGTNSIPASIVVDAIKEANQGERDQIRATFQKIDFHNGDVMHFVKHLAQAIAI